VSSLNKNIFSKRTAIVPLFLFLYIQYSYNIYLVMASKLSNPHGMQKYAAPSLFQPHRMRQALRDAHEGKIAPLVGYYFGLSSVQYARVVAPMGFDVAWIDWEHSSCNVETMTDVCPTYLTQNKADTSFQMVHTISFMSEGKTIPVVR
jgi:4-hydroxy-2-oxoheptanedioate aldolase